MRAAPGSAFGGDDGFAIKFQGIGSSETQSTGISFGGLQRMDPIFQFHREAIPAQLFSPPSNYNQDWFGIPNSHKRGGCHRWRRSMPKRNPALVHHSISAVL